MDNKLNINNDVYNKILNSNINNIPEFGFYNNETKIAKVINVYDGDTITVVLCIDKLQNNIDMIYKFNVRMYGYNTEEIKQPINDHKRNEKKEWAIFQRNWLANKILNKIVFLECLGYDKYGRILGKVYLDNSKTQCINDIIIKQNIAVKYNL